MTCKDCPYYWQDDDDSIAICHYQWDDGDAPCERSDKMCAVEPEHDEFD